MRELALLLVITMVIGFIAYPFLKEYTKRSKGLRIKIGDNIVTTEIAETPSQRAKGLMFREHLDPDKGMFFIFPKEGNYNFWMANTKIPLDIMWMDSYMTIIYASKNTPPCKESTLSKCPSYGPTEPSMFVLEVNGGWMDEHGVQVGDILDL